MRKLICSGFLLAVIVAPAARAGDLYKCADAKGATTVQSDPCPAGSTQVWKRDSAPAPQPTLQQVIATHAPPQQTSGQSAAIAEGVWEKPGAHAADATDAAATPSTDSSAAAAASAGATAPSAGIVANTPTPEAVFTPAKPMPPIHVSNDCDNAKRFAAAVDEKVWLGLTPDQTQRLYGWVMSQCTKSDDENSDTGN
jgi:hypothetical protein